MRRHSSRLLTTLRRGGGLTYLLRDEFTTDEAAPLTSPRTCEPGPGTFTAVDTGNNMSISSGALVWSANAGSADPLLNSGPYTPSSGLAGYMREKQGSTNTKIRGWGAADNNYPWAFSLQRSYTREDSSAVSIGHPNTAGTWYKRVLVMRSVGGFFVTDGKLLWVYKDYDWGPGANHWWAFSQSNETVELQVDETAVLSLPANGYTAWETEFGPATDYNETPSTGATLTGEADAVHEFTWTAATGETLEWMIRRTDDTSTWSIRCDQAGSTIKTIEINSGETERASTAQTWTNATDYRIVVTADDEEIKNYVANTAKNTYSSASFNKTATGVKITGFAAGADLVAWPRDVSSLLPAELV